MHIEHTTYPANALARRTKAQNHPISARRCCEWGPVTQKDIPSFVLVNAATPGSAVACSFPFLLVSPPSVSLSHSCKQKTSLQKQKTRSASYKTNEAPQQQQPKSSFLDPRQPNEELESDEDADKQWQIRGNNNNNSPNLKGKNKHGKMCATTATQVEFFGSSTTQWRIWRDEVAKSHQSAQQTHQIRRAKVWCATTPQTAPGRKTQPEHKKEKKQRKKQEKSSTRL